MDPSPYLLILGTLLMAAGAGLWAVMGVGAAGRGPTWWGMAVTAVASLSILILMAIGLGMSVAEVPPQCVQTAMRWIYDRADVLCSGMVAVFGLSFMGHAFRLREALKRTRRMEETCARLMHWL